MKNTKSNKMFVYGTLMSQGVRDQFQIGSYKVKKAVLHNFRKEGLNIIASEGDKVEGMFFLVNDQDLEALDQYEGIPDLYHRMIVTVNVGEKQERVNVYQLNKGHEGSNIRGY